MSWFDGKLDRNNAFIATLIAQVVKSVEVLRQLELHLHEISAELLATLRTHASEAAELRRILIDDLHRTFITPLDREDIFNLSHCNNDVVSYALSSAEEMHILEVQADAAICAMVALIRQEAQELELALMRLPDNPRVAGDHATEVRRLEQEVEKVYRQAVKDLFAQTSDVARLPQIFYRREVYRHLSNLSDRADAAAHVIGMVVMKLA
jgi:uncharacterized protein Yka (UPF0111/DUF47 family)